MVSLTRESIFSRGVRGQFYSTPAVRPGYSHLRLYEWEALGRDINVFPRPQSFRPRGWIQWTKSPRRGWSRVDGEGWGIRRSLTPGRWLPGFLSGRRDVLSREESKQRCGFSFDGCSCCKTTVFYPSRVPQTQALKEYLTIALSNAWVTPL